MHCLTFLEKRRDLKLDAIVCLSLNISFPFFCLSHYIPSLCFSLPLKLFGLNGSELPEALTTCSDSFGSRGFLCFSSQIGVSHIILLAVVHAKHGGSGL